MFTWVHLCQWGDAIDVMGDADTKRMGTPGLWYVKHGMVSGMVFLEPQKVSKISRHIREYIQ